MSDSRDRDWLPPKASPESPVVEDDGPRDDRGGESSEGRIEGPRPVESETNSQEYWERRFSNDWDRRGGRDQSRDLMKQLLAYLPPAISEEILLEKYSVLDCGCAKGDGTAILAKNFPDSRVAGFDFSTTAVQEAQASYPTVEFFVGDLHQLDESIGFDVLISSHCFEHLERPICALRELRKRCNRFFILFIPLLETYPVCEEHARVIHPTTFPEHLDDWAMSHRILVPPLSAWPGNQLLLVYEPSRLVKVPSLQLVPTRKDLDTSRQLASLRQTLVSVAWLIPQSQRQASPGADEGAGEIERKRILHEAHRRLVQAAHESQLLETDFMLRSQEQQQELNLLQDDLSEARKTINRLRPAQFRHQALELMLQEERDRHRSSLAEASELRSLLTKITQSKAWRLLNTYWRLRRRLTDSTRWLRRIGRTALPPVVRRWWRERRQFRLRSWYAYRFDNYKKARQRLYADNLTNVQVPAKKGLVSIVLPVYNGEEYVGESIDSCLAQTYDNFELIAIDDGSTDRTGEILQEYAKKDPRIRLFRQENRKLPRTLSRGFRKARGEFFTWTSADNRFKPDFLERMVDCLRRHVNWDMAYANVDIIGSSGEPLRESVWYQDYQVPKGSEHIHLPRDTGELNVWPNNYVGAAFLYRASVAWVLGDYSRYRFTTEDYDYWMRINALLTMRHVDFDRPVYDYRFHSESLTARDDELGITEGRTQLMVFEDFRRDFYLCPAVWVLESAGEEQSSEMEEGLRSLLSDAGHIFLTPEEVDRSRSPVCFAPWIYVGFVRSGEDIEDPSPGIPSESLKVVVALDFEELPEEVSSTWDLCVTTASNVSLPRLKGRYCGWVSISSAEGLFSTLDARARTGYLGELERQIYESPAHDCLRASIIICTYLPNERLTRAIHSVADQAFPKSAYEVIVVNNSPVATDLQEEIEELRRTRFPSRPDCLRLIECPIPGLSHARNAGISVARGEVLCFLDDDAVAQDGWLKTVLEAFDDHQQAGVIGGHIELRPPNPHPAVLQEGWKRYWSHFAPEGENYAPVSFWWEFPWGANWSARRQALMEIGGFRTRYGRRARDFSGGEEIIAASLIQKLGYEIAVLPGARVYHDVEEERYSFHHVRKTIVAGVLVNYQAQRDLYIPMEASFRSTLRQLLSPGVDKTVRTTSWLARARHWLYRREAQLALLRRQLQDFFFRWILFRRS